MVQSAPIYIDIFIYIYKHREREREKERKRELSRVKRFIQNDTPKKSQNSKPHIKILNFKIIIKKVICSCAGTRFLKGFKDF